MILLLLACAAPEADPTGPSAAMDFASADFYGAPFPSDHRLDPGGVVDLSGFPDPDGVDIVSDVLSLLDGAAGFGTTSAIYFRVSDLDPESLPTLHDSADPGAAVFLVDVDPDSPERGRRFPLEVTWTADPGPYGAPDLLSALPLQGVPLRPDTRYAAGLTTAVTAGGVPLEPSTAVGELLVGHRPLGLSDTADARYREALETLDAQGHDLDALAALTVFTTWEPRAGMAALAEDIQRQPPPTPEGPPALTDTFDDYCVYQTTIELPVYQSGEPPYLTEGGGVIFDESGQPVLDHLEASRLVITVPTGEPPADGWPVAVMIRTGGGGDRPLVDRGVRDADGEPITPGEGPARYFARAGFAGVSIDGPHGGLRNVSGTDEQFLMFNVTNPEAMIDNLRQSAAELTLLPALVADLRFPGCTGDAHFDADTMALMGHSMGASIAPLTLAYAPDYDALLLSGAGGSWTENIVHKQLPLEVRPLAEAMLGYPEDDRALTEHDPFLNLLQWAGEVADVPIFAARSSVAPDVILFQGIVDHYILPPIANAASLSLGLDLAGPALDADHPELSEYRDLTGLLPLVDGTTLSLPAGGNRLSGGVPRTALVVQHGEDGVEDGHEVMFQLEAPKTQYVCFLEGLRRGQVPMITDDCELSEL